MAPASLIHDRVTTVGTGVDDAVLRLSTTYDVLGRPHKQTSYDNAAVGQGNVVNELESLYNDFGQITDSIQEHNGAVTGSSPKVELQYADGSDNTIRPTGMIYPNGRELTYSYDAAETIADMASRIAAIIDDDSTHLADYEYLGEGTFVVTDYTEPQVKYTLVDLDDDDDPDTGDIYSGLDRFGRTKDCRWFNYDAEDDIVRLKYGYDRASHRLWREDLVAQAFNKDFDELYTYDGLHRLQTMQRGLLNGNKTQVSNQTDGQCWNLDATENWTGMKQAEGGSTWTLEQGRDANEVNEITDITNTTGPAWSVPAYDPAGNMTTIPQPADPSKSFTATWDAWNRLVKLVDDDTSDTIAEYQYDAEGRRAVKRLYENDTLVETRHQYLSPAWQTLEERIGSSTDADRHFVWGLRFIDDLILRDRDGNGSSSGDGLNERLYSAQDTTWSVVGIVDRSGTFQRRFAYQPYGIVILLAADFTSATGDDEWAYRFTAREFDARSVLGNFRTRFYHTNLGHFIGRDEYEFPDGPSLYAAYFIPNSIDPWGRSCTVTPDGAAGWTPTGQVAIRPRRGRNPFFTYESIPFDPLNPGSAEYRGLPCFRSWTWEQSCTTTCTYCLFGRTWTTTTTRLHRGQQAQTRGRVVSDPTGGWICRAEPPRHTPDPLC